MCVLRMFWPVGQRQWIVVLAIGLLWMTAPKETPAEEKTAKEKDQRQVLRSIRRKLSNRNPTTRIEALGQLESIPGAASARIALRAAKDQTPAVRQAVRRTLTVLAGDSTVAELLLDQLGGKASGAAPLSAKIIVLAALCSIDSAKVHQQVIEILNGESVWAKQLQRGLVQVADTMGPQADPSLVRTIAVSSGANVFAQSFLFRRALVQALTRVRRKEAVAALIAMSPRLAGEVWSDAVPYLRRATGQQHGATAQAWQSWWKKNASTFEFPDQDAIPAASLLELQQDEGLARYYGVPLYAQKLVFVIDVSSSMRGRKLQAAKTELIEAVKNLPGKTSFSIVAFHRRVAVWRRELSPATDEFKRQAIQFVSQLGAADKTATYDALEAAFRFDSEAVFLLTDGAPSTGKIVAPKHILTAVTRQNRARRISIHVIGVQPGNADSVFAQFLARLAEDNFGHFRRVD